ncbi:MULTISPECIES: beta-N-acetylhexosaminidase [unclassified Caulobacter]|uniref:beta-N-acetylhexosaminidase n=1 Tax=unclassified Caulobacter TaxID=2648921 RepID=UPI0009E6E30F|nr:MULTISPECIES: family 20 glycosylhydrolase [unclassified Caulobacter]
MMASSPSRALFLALAAAANLTSPAPAATSPALVPWPAEIAPRAGDFRLTAKTRIHVPAGDAEAKAVALQLRDMLVRAGKPRLEVIDGGPIPAGAIVLKRSDSAGEAYGLKIAPTGVEIAAGDRKGLFYGAVTVWQLATNGPALPAMTIKDAPRYAWRGFMLDSARHFQSVDEVKRLIDAMAAYKLNVLHWHLNDDQGWRLEIKAYPKLTEVGAWRQPKGADAYRPAPAKYEPYGGFYTQAQAREIVAYAAARNIMVVPEIELPGHATAAITAYPELGVTGEVPTSGMSDWGVFANLYNIDDTTFAFLETVLDEVVTLFPGPYLHIGGDEAIKNQWQASPKIQAQMKALGIENEDKLQSWFINRIAAHLAKKGRRIIGWDEILEGGADQSSIVMAWRGVDRAAEAARLGHDTILTAHPQFYMDSRQSLSANEPPGRSELSTLKSLYTFDARTERLSEEQARHVIGVQANSFTEHQRTARRVEAMAFPRLTAVAELGWTAPERRDWPRYSNGLPVILDQLKALDIAHDDVPFEPEATLSRQDGKIGVTLASSLGVGEIRYATGGAIPTTASPLYAAPLALADGTKLKARSFLNGQPLGGARDIDVSTRALNTRVSSQLKFCGETVPLRLEADFPREGQRPVFMIGIYRPCWIWEGADLVKGATLTARIGQAPFNFQLAGGRRIVSFDTPKTSPYGELVVRKRETNGALCEGQTLAVIPIDAAAAGKAGLSEVTARIPPTEGVKEVCLTFNRPKQETLWALDAVTLEPGR